MDRTIKHNHIKGEISVDGFDLTAIIEYDGLKWNKIANCNSEENDEGLAKDIKNARLFAAAPDMFKALNDFCEDYEAFKKGEHTSMDVTEQIYNAAKYAIEKATKPL